MMKNLSSDSTAIGWTGRHHAGVAMLLVMILLVAAVVLSMGYLATQASSRTVAQNAQNHAQAQSIAEAGLLMAIRQVQNDDQWRTTYASGTWASNVWLLGGKVTILGQDGTLDADGLVQGDGSLSNNATDPLVLIATGTYRGATHTVRAMIQPTSTEQAGLLAEYFASDREIWSLSDIHWSDAPTYRQTVANINRSKEEHGVAGWSGGPHRYFGVRYTGQIDIPETGSWTFWTESDDGSALYIDGQQVVENDWTHAMSAQSGTVTLTKGKHSFKATWFEWDIHQGMIVSWKGPGISSKQVVPASAFTLGSPSSSLAALAVAGSIEMSGNAMLMWLDGANACGDLATTNATASKQVKLSGNAKIFGTLAVGPSGDPQTVVKLSGNAMIKGDLSAQASATKLPTSSAPSGLAAGSKTEWKDNERATISSSFQADSVTIKGNAYVKIQGHVVIYSQGDFTMRDNGRIDIEANSSLTVYSGQSVRLKDNALLNINTADSSKVSIINLSASETELKGNAQLYATIQSPLAQVTGTDNVLFRGSCTAASADLKGNAQFYLVPGTASDTSESRGTSGNTYAIVWKELR